MKTARYARVRRRRFKIADLEPAPYNARSITQEALRGLSSSLERFGVLAMPIVNVRHKPPRLVGGHQRVAALKAMGVKEVDCVVVDLDETIERQANVALNNPHIEGQFVPSLTRELLEEIAAQQIDTDTIPDLRLDVLLRQVIRGATAADADRVVKSGKVDDDAVVTVAKSSSVSKAGKVYALGAHRLFVGRLSEPTNLSVFETDVADMAFVTALSLPDETNADHLDVLLRHSFNNTVGAVYVACTPTVWPAAQGRIHECGGYWSNTIVLHGPTEPSAKVAFNDAATLLLYGWRQGQPHAFHGGRDQGNTWKLKTAVSGNLPVEAVVKAILNSTVTGARVLDVMADGGTTVVACEKTGRRLFGYASTPREADRVRRRWAQFVHGDGADWKALTAEV